MDDDHPNDSNNESATHTPYNAHFASLVVQDALAASYGHLKARLVPFSNTKNATGTDGAVFLRTYFTELLQPEQWDGTTVRDPLPVWQQPRGGVEGLVSTL
jgi:hypothetical protein